VGNDKKPLVQWKVFQERPPTEEEVKGWWRDFPSANVAILTGTVGGLTVLDFDPGHAPFPPDGCELPTGCVVSTPRGGKHYYFKHILGAKNSASKLARGIDVRGEGGYVVIPPSVVNAKPYTYEVGSLDDALRTEAPVWLLNALRRSADAPPVVTPGGERIPKSQRNATLISLAGTMRRRGMTEESILSALLDENILRCDPPLEEEEVRKVAASVARYKPRETSESGRKSQADRLVAMALRNGIELFNDQYGEPFARVRVQNHKEILSLKGRNFKRLIAHLFWQEKGKGLSSEALKTALNVLEGKAIFEGPQHKLHNRVAILDGAIYYDLCDRDWRVIKVTSQGWQIITDPPILFRRYSHQQPQVEPASGGDLREILKFLNLRDPAQQLLLMVYLVSCFVPDIAHPILVPHGPQGSAKTSFLRIIRRLIDPSVTDTLSFAATYKELVQQLCHHWAPFFDNVSYVSPLVSDTLCRAATGEGFCKRELYSDDEDIIYQFRRCVALNAINVPVQAPDILDRCLLFELDPIPEQQRRTESEIWRNFERVLPLLFGAVLDALTKAMAIQPSISLRTLPRLADFAVWGCAIARALGYSQDGFLAAFYENVQVRNCEVLSSSLVATVVLDFLGERESWKGSPSELFAQLGEVAEKLNINTKSSSWPKAAHVLTRRLNEIRPNLAAEGISVEYGKDHRRRTVILSKSPKNSVSSAAASPEAENKAESGDASLTGDKEASPIASRPGGASIGAGDDRDAGDAIFSQFSIPAVSPAPSNTARQDSLEPNRDYVRVEHPIDPEPFVVVFDENKIETAKAIFPGTVCYSIGELKLLENVGASEDLVKRAHLVKKTFPGARVENVLPDSAKPNHYPKNEE